MTADLDDDFLNKIENEEDELSIEISAANLWSKLVHILPRIASIKVLKN